MKSMLLTLFTCAAVIAAQSTRFPPGSFPIVSQSDTSLRWGIADNSTQPGSLVVASSEDGLAELWTYNFTTGYLTNVNTRNPSIVATVSADGTVTQDSANSEPNDVNQIWIYGDDTQTIGNLVNETQCATIVGSGSGIVMQTCNNSTEQKWVFNSDN